MFVARRVSSLKPITRLDRATEEHREDVRCTRGRAWPREIEVSRSKVIRLSFDRHVDRKVRETRGTEASASRTSAFVARGNGSLTISIGIPLRVVDADIARVRQVRRKMHSYTVRTWKLALPPRY